MSDTRHPILVLIKGLGIGGAERLIATSVPYWDTTRFRYHVAYVLPWKDNLVDDITRMGVGVTCIGGRRGMDPLTPFRLRRLLGEIDATLIHVHSPAVAIVARLASHLPIVYTEHNLAHSYRWPTRVLNRATYRRNAAVTAVSTAVGESLERFSGPPPEVVENGVDPTGLVDPELDVRDELGLDEHTKLVVHVGNIRPHKGHQTLIEAAEAIARQRDDIVIASIGGEKYPGDLERLRTAVDERGIGRTIRFLGRRPDATSFIAAADVYINPADVEGLPVSILEAMALAKPIVATAVGGVPSVVIEGETGRLVEPSDPAALAKVIMEVFEADDGGAALGRRAAQLVGDRYGVDRMVERFESIYRRVLAEPR